MEMNGSKLYKLIRGSVQAWLMVYLLDSTGKTDHDLFRKQRLRFPRFRCILWGNIMWYLQMQQSGLFTPNLLLLSWWKIEVISGVILKKELVLHQKFSHWRACIGKESSTHSHYVVDIVKILSTVVDQMLFFCMFQILRKHSPPGFGQCSLQDPTQGGCKALCELKGEYQYF